VKILKVEGPYHTAAFKGAKPAMRAASAAGCRRFIDVAFKPPPVTWLGEQLLDDAGARPPGVDALAVTIVELATAHTAI
jgi:hypothetical protein